MIRRRRRQREIPFSFDSFLDIVANVVGIIIRLILVAWVGARSYTTLRHLIAERRTETEAHNPLPALPSDPLDGAVARERQELARAQKLLLEQLRRLQGAQADRIQLEQQRDAVTALDRTVDGRASAVAARLAAGRRTAAAVTLSLDEYRARQRKLMQQIHELERAPQTKKRLYYRTPVSRPVHSEEFFFECRAGRVAFIDVASLLAEVRQGFEDKGKLVKNRWKATAYTGPLGAFRLRYTIERERGIADVAPDGAPDAGSPYRYGLSEWVVEPTAAVRGETLSGALSDKSEFRQIVDRIDPQQAVVTFWTYPDSFALFRELRDYLYRRDLVVAGRPLPEDAPITGSRSGSLSQGQ